MCAICTTAGLLGAAGLTGLFIKFFNGEKKTVLEKQLEKVTLDQFPRTEELIKSLGASKNQLAAAISILEKDPDKVLEYETGMCALYFTNFSKALGHVRGYLAPKLGKALAEDLGVYSGGELYPFLDPENRSEFPSRVYDQVKASKTTNLWDPDTQYGRNRHIALKGLRMVIAHVHQEVMAQEEKANRRYDDELDELLGPNNG